MISAATADEITTLNVESRIETYDYPSDTLSAIVLNPVLFNTATLPFIQLAGGVIDGIAQGCLTADVWGFQFGNQTEDMSFQFSSTLPRVVGLAASFGIDGVSFNGAASSFIPVVRPCGPTNVQTKLGGSTSLHVAHAGTGAYTRKINRGDFRVWRTIEISNGSSEVIELPIHISGVATAGVSLAPDATTFARADLSIQGVVDGQSFGESVSADGADGFPDTEQINLTRAFVVCPPHTTRTCVYDVTGEFSVDVMAKGIGFFGLITQSATAGVDLPDTLSIGHFTSAGGGPLPPNVNIRVAGPGGAVISDTTLGIEILEVGPGTASLRVRGPAGRICQVYHSGKLDDWVELGDPFVMDRPVADIVRTLPPGGRGFIQLRCD